MEFSATEGQAIEGFSFSLASLANIELAKSVNVPSPVSPGDSGYYEIVVTASTDNGAFSPATNFSLVDILPDGLTIDTTQGGGVGWEVFSAGEGTTTQDGGTYDPGTGIWDVGTVNIDGSVTLRIYFTVDLDQGGNVITNTVPLPSIDLDQDEVDVLAGNPITSTLPIEASFTVADSSEDFSDAPLTGTSYGGASHTIVAGIQLGATVTDETADYDDLAAAGDVDDGISAFPTLTAGDTSYTIPAGNISVTNTTGGAATLYAFFDFNGDGDFADAGETASVSVPDGATNPSGDLVFSGFTAVPTITETYVRFRLSTDAGLDANTAASDGEVEDYQVPVAVPPITSDDLETGVIGSEVDVDILANDTGGDTPDQTTVELIIPGGVTTSDPVVDADGDLVGFTVDGEGTWAYDDTTGLLTFTPEPGFLGDPTPISYTVEDADGDVSTPAATVTVDYPDPAPEVTLVKSLAAIDLDTAGTAAGVLDAGDLVSYSFTVTNSGNVPLYDVAITDAALGGAVTCAEGAITDPIAVGGSFTCTANETYALTQADIDAGAILNTADVAAAPSPGGVATITDTSDTGTAPDGTVDATPEATDSPNTIGGSADDGTPGDDPTITALTPSPSMTLVKSVSAIDHTGGANAALVDEGDVVSYSFEVANTGNVTLSSFVFGDALLNPVAPNAVTCTTTPADLAPGDSFVCTADATYTITAGDVAAGSISNTATVDATAPAPADGSAAPVVPQASSDTGTVADSVDGATPVAVVDPLTTDSDGAGGTDDDPTVLNIPSPGVTLVKSLAAIDLDTAGTAAGVLDAGDLVSYSFTVTNTGNVPLYDVAITDAALGGAVSCAEGAITDPIAVGGSFTCTANETYALTQADIDAGAILNTADVAAAPSSGGAATITDTSDTGTAPDGTVDATPEATDSPNTIGGSADDGTPGDDPTITALTPSPSMTLVKSVSAIDHTGGANAALVDEGDVVSYSFEVANTGNVTLSSFVFGDALLNPVAPNAVTCTTTPADLAPGDSFVCTADATYTITAGDVAAGSISNTATVDATAPAPADGSAAPVVPQASSDTGTVADSVDGATPVAVVDPLTTDSDGAGGTDDDPTVLNIPSPGVTLVKSLAAIDLDTAGTAAGVLDAGDLVSYSFTVTNSGNVPLYDVAITDAALGGAVSCAEGAITDPIAVGGSFTCTANETYALTQADIDAGAILNTADVAAAPSSGGAATITDTSDTGTAPDGTVDATPEATDSPNTIGGSADDGTPGDDPTITALTPSPSMTLVKSVSAIDHTGGANAALVDEGDVVSYSFEVANTGNVTLSSFVFGDALLNPVAPNAVTCTTTPADLAPGDSFVCTADATYTITAGDVAAGSISNTATVDATAPAPADGSAAPVVPQASSDTGTVADSVDGATPVAVVDPLTTDSDGAGGTDDDPTVLNIPSPGVTLVKSLAAIDLDTAGTAAGVLDAGDLVSYSFTVTNSGNVPLYDVAITDAALGGAVSCAEGAITDPIAVGGSFTCTANETYALTQADIDAGAILNTADVAAAPSSGGAATITDTSDTGTAPDGTVDATPEATDSPNTIGGSADDGTPGDDPTITALTPSPSMTLVKSVSAIDHTGGANAALVDEGDVVSYSFEVANTGNVTLSSFVFGDALLNPVAPNAVTCTTTPADLAPGDSFVCTADATYTITAGDVAAGSISNTATVDATAPAPADGSAAPVVPQASSDTGTVADSVDGATPVAVVDPLTTDSDGAGGTDDDPTVLNIPSPGVTLVKSLAAIDLDTAGTAAGVLDAGDLVSYSFTITNTGTVPLYDVAITDAALGGAVTCAEGAITDPIAVGGSFTCTANETYALTQADIDAGAILNTADVAAAPSPGGAATITDTSDTGTAPDGTVDATPEATDSPNTIGGSADDGTPGDDPTITALTPSPSMTLVKSVSAIDHTGGANAALVDEGDVVSYSFEVANTGNVTLSSFVFGDALLNPVAPNAVTCTTTPADLAPGDSFVCTADATYTITAGDVAAGSISNTATVDATAPAPADGSAAPVVPQASSDTGTVADSVDGATPVAVVDPLTTDSDGAGGTDDDPTVLNIPSPGVTLVKSLAAIDLDTAGTAAGVLDAGDLVSYSFTVTNTGNVPLYDVAITDAALGGAVSCAEGAITDPIAVGGSFTCTANETYALTQADIDAGAILNTADVAAAPSSGGAATITDTSDTGTAPDGTVDATPEATDSPNTIGGSADDGTPGDDPTITALTPSPSMTLVKSVSAIDHTGGANAALVDEGDVVSYSFEVANTGNVTLSSFVFGDALLNPVAPNAVTCTTTPADLAPGDSFVCTADATYTITAGDVAAGSISNTATVDATAPAPADGSAAPVVPQASSDTGTVADSVDGATPVAVVDPLTTDSDGAGGTDDDPTVLNIPSPGVTLVKSLAAIDLDTAGTAAGVLDAGDLVSYSFTVTNSGNVPLYDVAITDAALGGAVSCAEGAITDPIAVGGSFTCTANETYALTQADIDAGAILNTADVAAAPSSGGAATITDTSDTGTAPDGTVDATPEATDSPNTIGGSADDGTPGDDPTITALTPSPSMTLVKSVSAIDHTGGANAALVDEGDVVSYSFEVANTGNVTLSSFVFGDALLNPVAPNAVTCTTTPADLAPGDSFVCTADATYTITAGDVAAGSISNTATVDATAPAPADGSAAPVVPQASSDTGTVADSVDGATPVAVVDPLTTDSDGAGGTDDDPTVLNIPSPGVTLVKSLAAIDLDTAGTAAGVLDAGDTVSYSFTVTNSGNVPLYDVAITDAALGGAVSCAEGAITDPIAVGGSFTCTANETYALTQADIDAGAILNTADVAAAPSPGGAATITDTSDTGTAPDGTVDATPEATDSPNTIGGSADDGTPGDDPTITALAQMPRVELIKSVASVLDTNGSGVTDAGDTVNYSFTVINTGNVTLADIGVTDPLVAVSGGPLGSLAPGDSDTTTFTASYVLTQGDVDAGGVENTADATASSPTGTGDVTDVSDAGSDATGAAVTDPALTETDDLDAVNGDSNDTDFTNDVTPLAITQLPSVELIKSVASVADTNGSGVYGDLGDTVNFTFTVENTGNVALAGVTVSDATLAALSGTYDLVQPAGGFDGTLLPGEGPVLAATATYVLAIDDITLGSVSNIASVEATAVAIDINGDPDPTAPIAGIAPVTDTSDTGTTPVLDPTTGAVPSIADPAGTDSDGTPGNDGDEPTVVDLPAAFEIGGTVFLDTNGDGILDGGDDPTAGAGYTVNLYDADGNVVATTTAAADGTYSLVGMPAGTYRVGFVSPGGLGVGLTDPVTVDLATPVQSGVNQPIDPQGVFYDSATGAPIAGVTVQLTDASGTPLPAACLLPGQQGQVTGADGNYQFDIIAGADPACPASETEYQILVVSTPSTYLDTPSTIIPPSAGPAQVTGCAFDAVPGGACQLSASSSAPSPAAPTPYYYSFLIESGDPDVINNHIPLDPAIVTPTGGIVVSKRHGLPSDAVLLGQTVPYVITVENTNPLGAGPVNVVDVLPAGLTYVPGTAVVSGVSTEPTIDGRTLTFTDLTIPAGASIDISLSARVAANAPTGDLTNVAFVTDSSGTTVSNRATATVHRRPEAVFDCTDIIGKVFDDRNANGRQDDAHDPRIFDEVFTKTLPVSPGKTEGEPGIPGVRLVTATGTWITTDQYGRYHVPCAALPDKAGSNFILKLDTRSLPTGYRLTTENPRVMRITPGKVTRMNFGVSISRVVDVDLTAAAFSGTEMSDRLEVGLDRMIRQMTSKPSILKLTYFGKGESRRTINARLNEIEDFVRKKWKRHGRYKLTIERSIKRLQ